MGFRITVAVVLIASFATSQNSIAQSQLHNHRFSVVIQDPSDPTRAFTQEMLGNERLNNSQNRLSLISASQNDFPYPESGCGPVALLNILVWYQKYGLIEPLFRDSDPEHYKARLFDAIDQRIFEQSGVLRNESTGTHAQDIAVVLDDIVRDQSDGRLRVHTDYFPSPLQLADLLETMPNFRAGYVLAYPYDSNTNELQSLHAMTLIRADRAGYVTLATWGEKYRGLLQIKDGKQWFIPHDPERIRFRIAGMVRFIPFEPIVPSSPTPQ